MNSGLSDNSPRSDERDPHVTSSNDRQPTPTTVLLREEVEAEMESDDINWAMLLAFVFAIALVGLSIAIANMLVPIIFPS